MIDTEKN